MIVIPDDKSGVKEAFRARNEETCLLVVVGYASVTTLLWTLHEGVLSKIGPISEFTPSSTMPRVRLLVGMSSTGCVSREDHASFRRLEHVCEGRLQVRYVSSGATRDVHSKVYVWTNGRGSASRAWSGSANFTMQGLGISTAVQENLLHPVDPTKALIYAESRWADGLSCLQPGIESHVPLTKSRFSRNLSFPSTHSPDLNDIVRSEEFFLYSRARKQSYAKGAGVNWGTRDGRAQHDEAYLAIPSHIGVSDFFPEKNTPFRVVCDDGQELTMRGASGSVRAGKDLSTWPSNAVLGTYLRSRLGVASGHVIGVADLLHYGRTSVTISRLRSGEYTLDFDAESAPPDPLAESLIDRT